jgi:hypothetical protein
MEMAKDQPKVVETVEDPMRMVEMPEYQMRVEMPEDPMKV